jgi:hypothetical protein
LRLFEDSPQVFDWWKLAYINSITLDFDGPVVTPDTFRRLVSAFVDLLMAVTDKAAGTGKKTVWDMTVSTGSRLFVARAVADHKTTATTLRVLKALPKRPEQAGKRHCRSTSILCSKGIARREGNRADSEATKYGIAPTDFKLGHYPAVEEKFPAQFAIVRGILVDMD